MFLLFDELKLSENEELDYRICSLGCECQRVDNLRRQADDEILAVLVDVVPVAMMDCDREDVEGKRSEIVEENRSRLNGLRLVERERNGPVVVVDIVEYVAVVVVDIAEYVDVVVVVVEYVDAVVVEYVDVVVVEYVVVVDIDREMNLRSKGRHFDECIVQRQGFDKQLPGLLDDQLVDENRIENDVVAVRFERCVVNSKVDIDLDFRELERTLGPAV